MLPFNDYIKIPEGYYFSNEQEVYSVLENGFKNRLDSFLQQFISMRQKEKYPFLPEDKIPQYPFVNHPPLKDEIFTRRQDVSLFHKIARNYFDSRPLVLEVGGANCWLTSRLKDWNADVITTDVFSDEKNGLGSKKFYHKRDWMSVQMDVCDPIIFKTKFNIIVLNHCLHFYTDPQKLLSKYYDLLQDQGMIIILGYSLYTNEKIRQKKVTDIRNYYLGKYNLNLHFYPCLGYFEKKFDDFLKQNRFIFSPYVPGFRKRFLDIITGDKHGIAYRVKNYNNEQLLPVDDRKVRV